MDRYLLIVMTLAPLLELSGLQAGEAQAPVPSYAADLAAFQAERARAGGPGLSAGDRQAMADAAARLAAAMPAPGLVVGEEAPDFALPNAFGATVRLSELLADGPVVLTFYRGAWCPYCNLQLRGLKAALPHIERHGARLVAVTPQLPDKSRAQVEQDGYPFEILSDLDERVMSAYGLLFQVPPELVTLYKRNFALDLATYNGPGRYRLPVPGTYVIDRQGVIRWAFADTDYKARAEPADIIDALEHLARGG